MTLEKKLLLGMMAFATTFALSFNLNGNWDWTLAVASLLYAFIWFIYIIIKIEERDTADRHLKLQQEREKYAFQRENLRREFIEIDHDWRDAGRSV